MDSWIFTRNHQSEHNIIITFHLKPIDVRIHEFEEELWFYIIFWKRENDLRIGFREESNSR